jgi:hypothetical protein
MGASNEFGPLIQREMKYFLTTTHLKDYTSLLMDKSVWVVSTCIIWMIREMVNGEPSKIWDTL